MHDRERIIEGLIQHFIPDAVAPAPVADQPTDQSTNQTNDPAAADVRRLARALSNAAACEAAFAVSPAQRDRLLALAPGPITPPNPTLVERLATLADAILASLALDSWAGGPAPAVRGDDGSRRLVFEAPGVSIDVRIEPSLNRLHAYDCTGRVVGSPVTSLVWTEIDSGRRHTPSPDAHGFFEVEILAGSHRIDLVTDAGAVRTVSVAHPPEPAA